MTVFKTARFRQRVFALLWLLCFASEPPAPAQAEPRTDAAAQLEAAKAALETFRSEAVRGGVVPPELAPLQEALADAVAAAERRAALAGEIASAEEALKQARGQLESWTPPDYPSPRPAALLDAAREEAAAARQRLEAANAQAAWLDSEIISQRRDAEELAATARRLAEEAAREKEPAARAVKETGARIAAARARAAALQLGLLQDQLKAKRLEAARLEAARQIADRKLSAIGRDARLSGPDLESTLSRLRARLEELEKRRAALRRSALRAAGDAARNIALELDLADRQSGLISLEMEVWRRRAAFLDDREGKRNETSAFLRSARERLSALARQIEDDSAAALSEAEAAKARLRAAVDGAEKAGLEARAQAAEKRAGLFVEALRSLRSAQKAAQWLEADLADSLSAMGLAAGVSRSLWDTLRAVWQAEIYTVEDSIVVDGKKISGQRAVTVGKAAVVLVVLAGGYLLLRWAVYRMERWLVGRMSLAPEHAALARRWGLSLGVFALALSALHAAGIPLTAFAFLGGALAIGVGFATQNLIRNFISGLIILIERPFRVNDILDVAGVNGRVAAIGLRASVIRHWDGIETLIPNSALLEGNVTNWTHSDQLVRDTIRAGVAYGSDPRLVSDLLLGCAKEHGLVLPHPHPRVYFEDFGESSLVFRLDYWVDFSRASRPDVASDLRFMIAKAFASAGVEMAFPQRDVRLIADRPLPLRIERGGGGAQSGPGQDSRPMP